MELNKLIKNLQNIRSCADNISNVAENALINIDNISKKNLQLTFDAILGEVNKLYSSARNITMANINTTGYYTDEEFKNHSSLNIDNDILTFTFPSLIPSKIDDNVKNKPQQYAWIANTFCYAINSLLEEQNIDFYKVPVVITFVNHYESSAHFRDNDNLEVKYIVSSLTRNLIYDDSPMHCSMHFTYLPDEREYSEVIICPKNDFGKIYENILMNQDESKLKTVKKRTRTSRL